MELMPQAITVISVSIHKLILAYKLVAAEVGEEKREAHHPEAQRCGCP